MSKYSPEIVKKICTLLEKDSYTVEEVCANVGITATTFYEWQSEKPEFSEAIKKAREVFVNKMLRDCERSLNKLVNGFDYEEVKTTIVDDGRGKPKIKEKTTIKKTAAPNLGAIIHYQTNRDPENWKNRQAVDHTTNGKEINERVLVLEKEEDRKRLEEMRKFVENGEMPSIRRADD